MPTAFNSFAIGDVVTFQRSFTPEDFAAFARLSGDTNPLHHDESHAQRTSFGRTIVPMHLTLAPLSFVAGMVFPGEPSLYLGHEVRAAHAVYYGETLTYTARVESVNSALRVLTIRVLALRDTTVVLDALMQVQATADSWDGVSSLRILHTAAPGHALVTGASGEIGAAICLALASRGWSLLLQDRGNETQRGALLSKLDGLGARVEFASADLTVPSDRANLARRVAGLDDIEAVIHAASPNLDASLDQLVAVNYSALRELATAALPSMLARQKGRVLLISSTATLRGLQGWEDYSAAKSMAGGWTVGMHGRFSAYGVHGMVLLPGYVATRFSDKQRGNAAALLPQEVAAEVVEMIEAPKDVAIVLEVGRRTSGTLGFLATPARTDAAQDAASAPPAAARNANTLASTAVADVIRRILRLAPGTDLSGGGLGTTPGWDSLRQIEIVLALESAFAIRFSSRQLSELTQFGALLEACTAKTSAP